MSDMTKIQWTDATWNPTRGCTKIAQGCKNCYAETFAERFRGVSGHPYERGFDPRIVPDQLTVPLRWKKPRRIFVDSMSDLFHEAFDFDYIDLVFAVMALSPQHTFQVLTKRPKRAVEYFRSFDGGGAQSRGENCAEAMGTIFTDHEEWFRACDAVASSRFWRGLPNVWIGTSIATQADADANIPQLVRIPAAVRFLSVEPLLERIDLSLHLSLGEIGWVIVGGESGPRSRPMDGQWLDQIIRQTREANVPLFVKQYGAKPYLSYAVAGEGVLEMPLKMKDRKGGDWNEWPPDRRIREFPKG